MYRAQAYSAASATTPLASTTIPRHDPTENDVQIEILFCGICRSDLHSVRNECSEFNPTVYPIVPGHEIVGRVTKVGSAVTKFKSADTRRLAARSIRMAHVPSAGRALKIFARTWPSIWPQGRGPAAKVAEEKIAWEHYWERSTHANAEKSERAPCPRS